MPKFFNQLNHGEPKLNSELRFRNQKKIEAESRKNKSSSILARAAKFRSAAKFRNLRNCNAPATVHLSCAF